jgi:hypothetical protein
LGHVQKDLAAFRSQLLVNSQLSARRFLNSAMLRINDLPRSDHYSFACPLFVKGPLL